MTKTRKYVTTIFDESTHALNVSFHMMRVILFRHLIGVNCRLYMSPDQIFQVRNELVYLDVIGNNINHDQTGLNDILQTRYVWIISYIMDSST